MGNFEQLYSFLGNFKQGCGSGYFMHRFHFHTYRSRNDFHEKTTVDLRSTKFFIYYNQKVETKIRKRQKEGKIKANNMSTICVKGLHVYRFPLNYNFFYKCRGILHFINIQRRMG